jgi:hypothetical protein
MIQKFRRRTQTNLSLCEKLGPLCRGREQGDKFFMGVFATEIFDVVFLQHNIPA